MTTVSIRHLAPIHTSINDEPQEIHVDEVEEMQEIPVDVVRLSSFAGKTFQNYLYQAR